MKALAIVVSSIILSIAALGAIAYDPTPDSVAMPGDPGRWYRPADTPEKRYEVAMKEANAALKEARDECRRADAGERNACMSEALKVYRDDVASARSLRSGSSTPG